jgi:hypothetical protein
VENLCPIHEDAPNPHCRACNSTRHDWVTTDSAKINRLRDALQTKASAGMLGVVAARANLSEGMLRNWCDNPANVPTYSELIELQAALDLEQLFDPKEEFPDESIEKSVGDDYRGGGG